MQILKSAVEYVLEFKRQAQADIIAYPPRIVLTLRHLSEPPPGALECQLNFSGIREVSYFNLYVLPYSNSETLAQRSKGTVCIPSDCAHYKNNADTCIFNLY